MRSLVAMSICKNFEKRSNLWKEKPSCSIALKKEIKADQLISFVSGGNGMNDFVIQVVPLAFASNFNFTLEHVLCVYRMSKVLLLK